MQFLRTVFWVVLAVVIVLFSARNSQPVQVFLWGDLYWNPPLWTVVVVAFLLGLVPTLLLHRATRWNLNRKLDAANRNLTETRAVVEPVRVDPIPPAML
jgi:lipopolysaccharide assembly protein A